MQSQFTPTPAQKQHFEDYILPIVQKSAGAHWRRRDGDRDDWCADIVCEAWNMYVNCVEHNRPYSATSLAEYGRRRVRDNRRCYCRPGMTLEGRGAFKRRIWTDPVPVEVLRRLEDGRMRYLFGGEDSRRPASPFDYAVVRVDFPAWVAKRKPTVLRRALRVMLKHPWMSATLLAWKLGVSVARVSQLRKRLVADWFRFSS